MMFLLALLAAVASAQFENMTILEAALQVPELSLLVETVQALGLADALNDTSTLITVFAPVNYAFSVFSGAADAELLGYHLITSGAFPSTDLEEGSNFVLSSLGPALEIVLNGDDVTIPFAFGFNPANISASTATVISANIQCLNGVVHLIDRVIEPPADIITLATAAGLNTLLEKVTEAGAADTLNAAPATIFAPTDAAFTAFAAEYPDVVVDITLLLNHVVLDQVFSTDVFIGDAVTMAGGQEFEISSSDVVDIKIGDATFETFDVIYKTGVVHVIDKVLYVPPMTSSSSTGAADDDDDELVANSAISSSVGFALLALLFSTHKFF